MRSSIGRSEGLGWGVWLVVVIVVLVIAGAVALAVYGGHVSPQQHQVEQVLPNDRFSN